MASGPPFPLTGVVDLGAGKLELVQVAANPPAQMYFRVRWQEIYVACVRLETAFELSSRLLAAENNVTHNPVSVHFERATIWQFSFLRH